MGKVGVVRCDRIDECFIRFPKNFREVQRKPLNNNDLGVTERNWIKPSELATARIG